MDLLQKRPTRPETTVDLLLDCHERIRRFSTVAERLVTAEAPDAQITDAARSLSAYFGRAFPLHSQDEDVSIRSRVEAAGHPLASTLRALGEEHEAMHGVLERLLPRWRAIADAPALRSAQLVDLRAETEELVRQVEPHLALEEERVFPVLRAILTPDDDRAIMREMRARRG